MLTKTSCYSAVDIVVSVMVDDVETVLVDVLEQDRQACYDAVRIAGSVLNTNSTVNLGFDPEEIGTKLKFGTELLWVVPNNISKILSNPLRGKKVIGGHVFCRPKSLFHEKTTEKKLKKFLIKQWMQYPN